VQAGSEVGQPAGGGAQDIVAAVHDRGQGLEDGVGRALEAGEEVGS